MRGIMLPDSALNTKVITGAIATNRARDPHSAARATKNAALVTAAIKLAHVKAMTEPGTNWNASAAQASVNTNWHHAMMEIATMRAAVEAAALMPSDRNRSCKPDASSPRLRDAMDADENMMKISAMPAALPRTNMPFSDMTCTVTVGRSTAKARALAAFTSCNAASEAPGSGEAASTRTRGSERLNPLGMCTVASTPWIPGSDSRTSETCTRCIAHDCIASAKSRASAEPDSSTTAISNRNPSVASKCR